MLQRLLSDDNVWTIYSIGAPNFMYKVFNAIAMLGEGGVLARMGQIGFLVGLFVLVYRIATAAGSLSDLKQSMIAGVIFAAMFGTTTTVKIVGMVPTPGGVSGGDVRVVDNVPWGIAAIGGVISGTGVYITRRMETAFRDPNAIPVTQGGFGRTAEILASVRSLSLSSIPNTLPVYDYYRRSMLAYLRDCAMRARQFEILSDNTLENAPDPLSAIRWDNEVQETRSWLESMSGESVAMSCPDAHALLVSKQADMASGLDPAYRARFGAGSQESIGRALASVANRGAKDAQTYMAASMINSLWLEAASGSSFGSMGNQNTLMIQAALEQRRTQWAAEETVFLKTMRPMIGYFESFFYALSPFVAFLIGLGAMGLRMIVKYVSLTLAVALWMPVLAITNLYQVTTLQDFFALQERMASDAGSGIWSLSNSATILDQATEAVALASMIAAATPMLTLTLLFGGAVAATSLFSRLQGQDHINEKIATPDPVSAPPTFQAASQFTGSPTKGAIETGSEQTDLTTNVGQVLAAATKSAQTQAQQSAASANTKLASTLAASKERSEVFSEALKNQFSDSQAMSENQALQTLLNKGYSVNDVMQYLSSNSTSEALSESVSGNLGVSTKLLSTIVGKVANQVLDSESKATPQKQPDGSVDTKSSSTSKGKAGDLVKALGKSLSAGLEVGVSARGEEQAATSGSNSSGLTDTKGMSTADSRLMQLARQEAIESAWDTSQQDMARLGVSASDSREISRGLSESVSRGRSYEQSATLTEQTGTTQSVPWLNWSKSVADDSSGFLSELRSQASELGGEGALQANLAHVRQNSGITDDRQAMAYASLMTLEGTGPGAAVTENLPGLAGRETERLQALAGAFARYYAMSGPTDRGAASVNDGVGQSAPEAGAVMAATRGAGAGSPSSKSEVTREIDGVQEAVGRGTEAVAINRSAQEHNYSARTAEHRSEFNSDAAAARNEDASDVAKLIDASGIDGALAYKDEGVATIAQFSLMPGAPSGLQDWMSLLGSERGRELESFKDEARELGLPDEERDVYAAARYMQANSFDLAPFTDSGRAPIYEKIDEPGPMKSAIDAVTAYVKEHPESETSKLIHAATEEALTRGGKSILISGSGGRFNDN
ncbi:hypothetical protein C7S18_23695 (plasmid) [Ahniella affigens]|uniref:TraG N-terminal Proteobacteria domain-containing protein n=1 Tax=Ahniella affigens TaxID=2021234 RepID=A0A2P1PZM8_9GAMM|nr:conjugal transfer protein TraG N-terminal domain-containing protein [Ahniella affigens]AVQ00304.1 hypothetical protein C7S18_23695 [Ahniella affigens]